MITYVAVQHEFVQPTVHEIYQKIITREIHKHHIYHRILPLLTTEILTAKHFIEASDGKGRLVEASNDDVRQLTGLPVREWTVIPRSLTIGQHRGEPQAPQLPENCSQPGHEPIEIGTEPILVDKKTHVTADGIVRTEYLWRHPPVFEDVHGRTTPVRVPAGISDDWRQIALKTRRDRANTHTSRDIASDLRRTNGVEYGYLSNKAARGALSSDERSPSQRAGEPVLPTKANTMAMSEHSGLAIRTVPKEGDSICSGDGSPSSARRSSNTTQSVKGSPNSTRRSSLPQQPWRI